MALALAVVIQTAEEREPFCRKGTVPFRQNDPTNVQYLADSFGIYSCVQEIDGQFPNQMVNFVTAADRFSFCSLLEGTLSTLNLFRFNVGWFLLVFCFVSRLQSIPCALIWPRDFGSVRQIRVHLFFGGPEQIRRDGQAS